MAYTPYYAELSAEGVDPVRFHGSGTLDALGLTGDGITGWYSMPAVKVDATARGQGDGGHDIAEDTIMYASRTVTLHWNANSADRAGVLAMTDLIRRFAHRLVRLRVVDADSDTYCEGGYLAMNQASVYRHAMVEPSSVTIVFERPERLATNAQLFQLLPLDGQGQGLSYGDRLETYWTGTPNDSVSVLSVTPVSDGLAYPVCYGRPGGDGRNRGVLENHGTSRAYPQLSVVGDFPQGVRLLLGDGAIIEYTQPVTVGAPLSLDFRSRTARIDGRDMSRWLSHRGFSPIKARSSMSIVLKSEGEGYVTCLTHDTYM